MTKQIIINLVKRVVSKTLSPSQQRAVRRYYKVWQLLRSEKDGEPEMKALETLIHPGDSVADVGANVGEYTKVLASLVGANGKVYSFEPISHNFEILKSFTQSGRLLNVRCFQAAVGSESGRREMVVPDSRDLQRFYLAHFATPGDVGPREEVQVLTLDELYRTEFESRLDFIKCDVEGAELEALTGGLSLLALRQCGWLMEIILKTSGEVFRLMKDHGYRAFVYSDCKLVPTEGYRNKEFSNYFFFHPGSALYKRTISLQAQ